MMRELMIKGALCIGVCYLMLRAFLVFMICCIVHTLAEARARLA